MKKQHLFFNLLLLCISTQSISATKPTQSNFLEDLSKIKPTIYDLSLGPIWANTGSTQALQLTSQVENTYVGSKVSRPLFEAAVFIGWVNNIHKNLQNQIGFTYQATSNTGVSGTIWQLSDPEFDNETYHYQVNHMHIAIKDKLVLHALSEYFQPFVNFSLGLGFNDASNFTNTPTISSVLPVPNFTNKTTTAFSYTLGAGFQKAVTSHLTLGIAYEFEDWGRYALGLAPLQTYNATLGNQHLYTNGLQLNVSYMI